MYEGLRRSVYGEISGLEIRLRPSRIALIKRFLEQSGIRRKIKLYNADLNVPHRYISEKAKVLFDLESPESLDPSVPSVSIIPVLSGSEIKKVIIDGRASRTLDNRLYEEIYDRISSSIIIVYSDSSSGFSHLLNELNSRDIGRINYRKTGGKTFESYGQVHYTGERTSIHGKICIGADSFIYAEAGLPGIMEVSRISNLPLQTASVVTPGTAVSSLEIAEAVRSGILIPAYKDDHESPKSLSLLRLADRGGLTLQPDPGLYWNATEIDFSSMYPSIIVRYNLSPEMLGNGDYTVPGLGYSIKSSPKGFLSRALENLLERRLFYKSIKGRHETYANRDIALKWMLLTSFGYTGYKNAKFGKIEIHESITAIGRWALSVAIEEARNMGFIVIHGIVDSLWVSGGGNVDELLKRIKERTRIDIVIDSEYKWILFPPARNGYGSPGSYIGMRSDGTFKIRGLDIRRKNIPEICKDFQRDAASIFGSCISDAEVFAKRSDLEKLKRTYLEKLNKAGTEDLTISFHITRRPEEYTVNTVTKKLLDRLKKAGVEMNPGENVSAVVVDRRNGVFDRTGKGIDYDRVMYRKTLERSFEPFDFIVKAAELNLTSSANDRKDVLYLSGKHANGNVADLYDF